MKKLVILSMLFSSLFASQSFASQPLPKTNLEKALYCYLNTGLLSNWGSEEYRGTFFIYDHNGVPWPENKIAPYVAKSPFEMASLVTYTDRGTTSAPEVGVLYLGYWDQAKNVEKEYVFDTGKIRCPDASASGKNCVKYLELNIGNRSFFVRFESEEIKIIGKKGHTGEYSRRASFITNEERNTLSDKLIKISPTKENPHNVSTSYMIALRAKQMLEHKISDKEHRLKDSFENYCNLEKLEKWDNKNRETMESFQ